ncbi:hypothetical protein E1B28_007356 [Marasmius oreades]|uniref:Uncharacterized protein n=1 Tax=Marasmius oreades TaxID=181124 RepID=A0A9P7S1H1_9AGAR|nr:uncharacterized protein E1B28_007356 [Marasmius oreades]KAG7093701.1 hypothetical protein E1B28_007356 [Marasmius oreades]
MMRGDVAPFLPFADSPKFPTHKLLRSLQWTPRFSFDPEIESLEYEVARQLRFDHGFTDDDIDGMELFYRHRDEVWKDRPRFLRLRKENKSGLLWEHNQRDHSATWPRLKSGDEKHFPVSYLLVDNIPEQVNSLFSNVNRGSYQFCPNLNCLLHFCGVHIRESGLPPFDPIPPNQKSWLKNLNVTVEGRPECGPCCYRLVYDQDQWQENILPCNEEETALIEDLLKFEPNICPCDLAVICRISCKAVYHHCLRIFSLEPGFESMLMQIEPGEEVESAVIPKPRLYYNSNESSIHKWNIERQLCTCTDEETCERSPNCLCKHHGVFCERNCRCKRSCGLRFPGCECQDGCRSKGTCRCLGYSRECSPELCFKCNARGDENHREGKRIQCRNVRIMAGILPLLEIKRAQYGAGAFATEGIRQKQYIGEYVGELLPVNFEEFERKEAINDYRKLNYLFSLNSNNFVLDADCMGNETRCLNEDKEGANCEVFELFVNGEPRIGIRATKPIKSGEELYLHYGNQYWTGDDH